MASSRLMIPLAVCTVIACGDSAEDEASATSTAAPAKSAADDSKSSETTEPPTAPAADPVPEVPAGPVGLKAEDNNPALVELAAGMSECNVNSSSPAYNCATLRPFVDALDPEADVGTLINFLEDPSEDVRYLAIYALDYKMILQKAAGRAHTDRVLSAAEAETHAAVATELGENLLLLDFEDQAVAGRVQAMAVAGLGCWIFGGMGSANEVHIGASGVIFGFLGFLMARGWFERKAGPIFLSLIVIYFFHNMLLGMAPSKSTS